jgi:16S rRNA (guanine527-N7)-methyltransferase
VGESTLADFWSRHFVDSAQLRWFDPDALVWADLGSGAGLPGIVLAILLKDRPGARVHLVESMAKRCRFLSEAVEVLDLPAQVHNVRAEALTLKVDVVTARACAPLDRLLGFSRGFFDRGARGLFLKGSDVQTEISVANSHWRFDAEVFTSLSDPRGQVVAIPHLAPHKPTTMKARR